VTAQDRSNDIAAGTRLADGSALHCAITVQGHLAARWSTWFDGLQLTRNDDATTVISGPIVDQAALHGLLQKLRDLGIPLISLTTSSSDTDPTHNERP
jgi:hypothetical protein